MSVKIEARPRSKRDKDSHAEMMEVWPRARPGMKVRCLTPLAGGPGVRVPELGKVYTIRELRRGLWRAWAVGFTLREIVNEIDPDQGAEAFWAADDFQFLDDEAEYRKFVNKLLTGHEWPN